MHANPGLIGLFLCLPIAAAFIIWTVKYRRAVRRRLTEWRARDTQSDDDFVRACGVSVGDQRVDLLLAARRALADCRGVPPLTIHAEDSLRDSFWDSLDLVEVVMDVETRMNVRVDDRKLSWATGRSSPARVEDWVVAIVSAAELRPPKISKLPQTQAS